MRMKCTIIALLFYFASAILGLFIEPRDLNGALRASYDYIIVGCGISGLVVTNRLSEDSSVTVLCIEAGIADHYEAIIQDPVYVGADIGGIYDWDLTTVPQSQLDGATRPMPQGKVLGGGSILNAMCWNRGGQDDYDAWEALGNPGWGWDGMLPYFMRSETYTPVYSSEIAEEYFINYNPDVHGYSGPVQVSYPKYFYPQSINLFEGLNYLGVPTEFDPNDGTSAGAAFVPTDLDPNNQTRSDARRTYYDPYATRENFHVITGQHVTRIILDGVSADEETSNPTYGGDSDGDGSATTTQDLGFGPGSSPPAATNLPSSRLRRDSCSSDLHVSGVEFAPNASSPRQTVYATREVIVAAGALHTAQLLQLSGIGPAALLEEFDITVALDMPGVGNNLQDHCLVGTFYPYNNASYPSPTELTTNATYNADAEAEYYATKTGPWTAGSPNGLAFPPLSLTSNVSANILASAAGQEIDEYLISGLDESIIAGYAVQKNSVIERLGLNTTAAWEIINNNAGSLTVSVMHPLSRGTCTINSPDPFEPPQIDPRWLTNPLDRQILIEALLFNQRLLATPPMLELQAAQFVPPANADEDALNQIINNGIRTEFHPSGTCAMLPLEMGGVVDSSLRVYGTQNLRVVDASIFPLIPAAHLQAVVYGVAEKAADIIREENAGSPSCPSSVNSSVSNSTSLSSVSVVVNLTLVTVAVPAPFANSTAMLSTETASFSSLAAATTLSSATSSTAASLLSQAMSSAAILTSSSVTIPTTATSTSTTGASPSSSPSSTPPMAIVSPLEPVASSSSTILISVSVSPTPSEQSAGASSIIQASSSSVAPIAAASVVSSTASSNTLAAELSSVFEDVSSIAASTSTSSLTSAFAPTSVAGPSSVVLPLSPTTSSLGVIPASSVAVTEVIASISSVIAAFAPTSSLSLLPEPQFSSSVVEVLTSEGLPLSAASSIASVLLGSASTASTAPSTTTSTVDAEEQQQTAIMAFLKWILNFFHVS